MADIGGSFPGVYLVSGRSDSTPLVKDIGDSFALDVVPYYWDTALLEYVVGTTSGSGVGEEVKVTNIVPVTVASLPLPSGASTGAKQDTGNTSLASIDGKLPAGGLATSGKQDTGNASLASIDAKLATPLPVSGAFYPITQPVSAAALPLPAGAAIEAGNLATIAGKDFATQATLAAVLAKLVATPALEGGNLATIAGKDFATQATLVAVLAKLIAAPATEAKQDTGNTSLATIAGKDFATQTTLASLLAELMLKADFNETQPVKEYHPVASATTSPDYHSITDSTRNLALIAANANRRSLKVVNKTAVAIPVSENGVASPFNYTKLLAPQEEWELAYPACTVALNGYFSSIPDQPILVTERS